MDVIKKNKNSEAISGKASSASQNIENVTIEHTEFVKDSLQRMYWQAY